MQALASRDWTWCEASMAKMEPTGCPGGARLTKFPAKIPASDPPRNPCFSITKKHGFGMAPQGGLGAPKRPHLGLAGGADLPPRPCTDGHMRQHVPLWGPSGLIWSPREGQKVCCVSPLHSGKTKPAPTEVLQAAPELPCGLLGVAGGLTFPLYHTLCFDWAAFLFWGPWGRLAWPFQRSPREACADPGSYTPLLAARCFLRYLKKRGRPFHDSRNLKKHENY